MPDNGPIQGVFDFESGCMDGYQNWQKQQEERLEAIRREWGLPINNRVRIKLKNVIGEIEGKLQLREHPDTIDRCVPLYLKVANFEVFIADIENCVVLE